jgi:hypothetical protein
LGESNPHVLKDDLQLLFREVLRGSAMADLPREAWLELYDVGRSNICAG